jgi:membrane fusion protein, multidrug efflux system
VLLKLRRDLASGMVRAPQINRIRVTLELEDGTRYGPAGHLDFLDMSVDETTGTVSIRAEFPNPQRLLLPGQFVRARVESGVMTQGISVPQRAVQVNPQGASVFVVGANNVAASRPVRLGELQGGEWIIRDGLKAGDRVIVNGVQMVRPGTPVRVAPPRTAAAAGPPRP